MKLPREIHNNAKLKIGIDFCSDTHRIHGTGIYIYIPTFTININYIKVGKYVSPMDPSWDR